MTQASGHQPQQLIAGGVAERVVHVLEVVEIEAEHGELPALTEPGDRRFHVFLEQHRGSAGWSARRGAP